MVAILVAAVITVFARLSSGIVTLEQEHYNCHENSGSVKICIKTDRELCLKITTHDHEAVGGNDYSVVNTIQTVSNGWCQSVNIINDLLPEMDETFTLSLSEVPKITDGCDNTTDNSSIDLGSGSGSFGPSTTTQDILEPDFNGTAVINIVDDDFVVVVASAVSGGFILIVLTTLVFCCIMVKYCKNRRRKYRGREPVRDVYVEFNEHAVPEMEEKEEVEETFVLTVRDIPIAEFAAHVRELHKEADKGFYLEYRSLRGRSCEFPCTAAQLECNEEKNRYTNTFPYDHSRVKLSVTEKNTSDYINANWIDGYNKTDAYVACQGPLDETIGDFWRMIWEYKLPTIVMLTRLVEMSKPKCAQYWPKAVGDTITPGGRLSVLLKEVKPFADYEMRTMVASIGSLKLKVTHYAFLSWPDHGVPRYPTALLGFLKQVRKLHFPSDPAPLLVHCSAGVGRTGTFIALDIIMQSIAAEEDLNVYECVRKLRTKRCKMVQTEAQYVFIHDALDEFITCGHTEITAANMRITANKLSKTILKKNITGFQEEFELLQQVSRQPLDSDLTFCQKEFNISKNRYSEFVPYDHHRVTLRVTGQPGSDYINASWINGYRQNNAYVTTQGPMKDTVNDFWRMVWEIKSGTIVMLCGLVENEMETCVQYWPKKGMEASYGNLRVINKSEEVNDAICCRKFDVYRLVSGGSVRLMHATGSTLVDVATVTQFQCRCWPGDGLPSSPDPVLELVSRVLKNQMSSGNKPITVVCSNGSGRSGVFVVLHSQLERLKAEGVVDVFQGVKTARIQRMGIVENADSYQFIHELLIKYVEDFGNYRNFQ